MYSAAGDEVYLSAAEGVEDRLKELLVTYDGLDHDIGFLFLPSAVANYRKTDSPESRRTGLHAANILAGRFNPAGNYIRAWNNGLWAGHEVSGWMITAAGLLTLADQVGEYEKGLYTKAAIRILRPCGAKFCNWDPAGKELFIW